MPGEAETAGPLLKVTDLVKEYPSPGGALRVLDGVAFELARGGSAAVTGPSGSGKSTLLHILGALDVPTRGEVLFDGENVHALPPRRAAEFRNREIGFVFQDHHLLPQCTALENVLVPCLAFGSATGKAAARAEELLAAVGLDARRDHFPPELSGGERQRVAIARSLVNSPRLVLCDEPTGDLDAKDAEDVARLLLSLRDERGVATLVVTHNEPLARVFGRRLRLEDGAIVE